MRCLFVLLSCFCVSGALFSREPPLLSIGGGVLTTHTPKALMQVELKGSFDCTPLRPQVGALTAEFNSFYAYAGLGIDLFCGKYLVVTPSFSPGLYAKGNGVDLGCPLEFRSCIEVALKVHRKCRLGGMFFHLSNASIGNKNPGVNAVVGFIAIPI